MRISGLVSLVFQVYFLVVLARVIFSWLRLPPRGLLTEYVGPAVYALTEPLLRPIRRVLFRHQGGLPIDFSPMLLILILSVLETIILRALLSAGL